MSEINFTITNSFTSKYKAANFSKRLTSAASNQDELNAVLGSLVTMSGLPDNMDIYIRSITTRNNETIIEAYSGLIDTPTWLIDGFIECGSSAAHIREEGDDGVTSYYYIGDKKAGMTAYIDYVRSLNLSADTEYDESDLFLPNGRTQVEAELLDYEWCSNDFGDRCIMRFALKTGETFYYKGNSEKLLQVINDDYDSVCEFTASFERGYLSIDGNPVALAKRPADVKVSKISPTEHGIPTLTGENKKFADEPLGQLVRSYFLDHKADINSLFLSIRKNKVGDHYFPQMIAILKESELSQYRFEAFGLHIYLSTNNKNEIEIESDSEHGAIDVDSIVSHITGLDTDKFNTTQEVSYFETYWRIDVVEVHIQVSEEKLRLCLTEVVEKGFTSPAEEFHHYTSNPGCASMSDWKRLFLKTKESAENGNAESMNILAHLYSTGSGVERSYEEEDKWRKKAGLLGNTSALCRLGDKHTRQDSSPDDFMTGLNYYKKCGELGGDFGWDRYEHILTVKPRRVKGLVLDKDNRFPEIDTSYWKPSSKIWMKKRRSEWKLIEHMLPSHFTKKQTKYFKNYFLKGEIAFDEDAGFEDKFKLFYYLWLHPSWDEQILSKLRNDYLRYECVRRRYFFYNINLIKEHFVRYACSDDDLSTKTVIHTKDNESLFNAIIGDHEKCGYWIHGHFVPLDIPKADLFDLDLMGRWLCIQHLSPANEGMLYQYERPLEWWYQSVNANSDVLTEKDYNDKKWKLSLALYRIYNYKSYDHANPQQECFVERITKILDEREFLPEISEIIAAAKDDRIMVKDPWQINRDNLKRPKIIKKRNI
jgi:hypothetical protein